MPQGLPSEPKRPELLGADFDTYPYLSGYGLLQRVCRLMALDRRELASSLGLRLREGADLLALTQRPSRARNALCAVVGFEPTYAQGCWSPESWSPLQTGGALDRMAAPVRQCPECARHGYHTAVFQLPSIQDCPWHGRRLIELCPNCRRPLVALYTGAEKIGICPCGHDVLDIDTASVRMREFPTVHAKGWLDTYRCWARDQRSTRHLIVPERDSGWRQLYRQQAAPPNTPPSSDAVIEFERWSATGTAEPATRECWAWCLLGSDRPLTYVPLPGHMHTMLSHISEDVVRSFPAKMATPLELATLQGWDAKTPLEDNVRSRPDCFIAPHGQSESGETWLNLSVIEPGLLLLCGQLIDRAIVACGRELDTQAKSLQTARSDALNSIAGRTCLVQALEQLIRRGYAQGLDAVLRAYMQNQVPRGMPWWLPSIEIRARPGHLDGVCIAWLKTSAPQLRRIVEAPLPAPKVKAANRLSSRRYRRGNKRNAGRRRRGRAP